MRKNRKMTARWTDTHDYKTFHHPHTTNNEQFYPNKDLTKANLPYSQYNNPKRRKDYKTTNSSKEKVGTTTTTVTVNTH